MKESWSLEIIKKRSENQESFRTLDRSLLAGPQFPHQKSSGGREVSLHGRSCLEGQLMMGPFGKL